MKKDPDNTDVPSKDELYRRLDSVPINQERRFRRRLSKAKAPQALAAIGADIAEAARGVEKRNAPDCDERCGDSDQRGSAPGR